jgi:hypothetical protein
VIVYFPAYQLHDLMAGTDEFSRSEAVAVAVFGGMLSLLANCDSLAHFSFVFTAAVGGFLIQNWLLAKSFAGCRQ